ncbi:hypothetical protein ANO11243_072050 [Dothideomycetidae sp. 11243]|nr:hypothetical protein ANO11243_072050 [fungal sp. No.11243]
MHAENGMFHLVLSFRTHGKELCKTVASAMALGYPLPSLLQLQSRRSPEYTLLADIDMNLEAINGFRPEGDHDLMLLMDSSNAWFQLRPQVMLSRYYEHNTARSMSQTILLAGQLSSDNETDVKLASMDAVLGTVGAIRALMNSIRSLAAAEPKFNNMYEVIAHLMDTQQTTNTKSSKARVPAYNFRFDMNVISSADSKLIQGPVMDKTLKELARAKPPYWSMTSNELANGATWERRPLRMNSKAGVVPAIVMHERDGHEAERVWSKTWFSRALAPLWQTERQMPMAPVAFAGGRFWWPHRHGTEEYQVFIKGDRRLMDEHSVCGDSLEDTLSGQ